MTFWARSKKRKTQLLMEVPGKGEGRRQERRE